MIRGNPRQVKKKFQRSEGRDIPVHMSQGKAYRVRPEPGMRPIVAVQPRDGSQRRSTFSSSRERIGLPMKSDIPAS